MTSDIEQHISVIESVAGFTDESTPVGEAWAAILAHIRRVEAERDEAHRQCNALTDRLRESDREWYGKLNAADMENATLHQRLAEQQAIIDKLPKTADGVPVVPGMEVWCRFRNGKQIVGGTAYRSFTGRLTVDYHDQINLGDNDDDPIWAAQSDPSLSCIFSTRAAAIAAKEGESRPHPPGPPSPPKGKDQYFA